MTPPNTEDSQNGDRTDAVVTERSDLDATETGRNEIGENEPVTGEIGTDGPDMDEHDPDDTSEVGDASRQ